MPSWCARAQAEPAQPSLRRIIFKATRNLYPSLLQFAHELRCLLAATYRAFGEPSASAVSRAAFRVDTQLESALQLLPIRQRAELVLSAWSPGWSPGSDPAAAPQQPPPSSQNAVGTGAGAAGAAGAADAAAVAAAAAAEKQDAVGSAGTAITGVTPEEGVRRSSRAGKSVRACPTSTWELVAAQLAADERSRERQQKEQRAAEAARAEAWVEFAVPAEEMGELHHSAELAAVALALLTVGPPLGLSAGGGWEAAGVGVGAAVGRGASAADVAGSAGSAGAGAGAGRGDGGSGGGSGLALGGAGSAAAPSLADLQLALALPRVSSVWARVHAALLNHYAALSAAAAQDEEEAAGGAAAHVERGARKSAPPALLLLPRSAAHAGRAAHPAPAVGQGPKGGAPASSSAAEEAADVFGRVCAALCAFVAERRERRLAELRRLSGEEEEMAAGADDDNDNDDANGEGHKPGAGGARAAAVANGAGRAGAEAEGAAVAVPAYSSVCAGAEDWLADEGGSGARASPALRAFLATGQGCGAALAASAPAAAHGARADAHAAVRARCAAAYERLSAWERAHLLSCACDAALAGSAEAGAAVRARMSARGGGGGAAGGEASAALLAETNLAECLGVRRAALCPRALRAADALACRYCCSLPLPF